MSLFADLNTCGVALIDESSSFSSSIPASSDFCRLLITFADNLD